MVNVIKKQFAQEVSKLIKSLGRYDLAFKIVHKRVRDGLYPVTYLKMLKEYKKRL